MRYPPAILLVVSLITLSCGAGDRTTWRVEEVHAGVPLTGAHALLPCSECHGSGSYDWAEDTCYGCHGADFEGATFDHALVGGSTDCALCHSTAAWSPSRFDHSLFDFPLTGRHQAVSCTSCHIDGVWEGQPTTCEACHWTRSQDDPWSLALGGSCGDCHTTAGWPGAPFDHFARTGFRLEGGHATISCVACHPGFDAGSTPTGCNDCHADDASGAGHPAFAAGCAECHSTNAWLPSTFNHEPAFPISTGRHDGFACTDCHMGGEFQTFTCGSTCHVQSEMDREHDEVAGYSYISAECYRCHPRGTGGDYTDLPSPERRACAPRGSAPPGQ